MTATKPRSFSFVTHAMEMMRLCIAVNLSSYKRGWLRDAETAPSARSASRIVATEQEIDFRQNGLGAPSLRGRSVPVVSPSNDIVNPWRAII